MLFNCQYQVFAIHSFFLEGGCTRGYVSQRAGVVRTEPSRFSTRVRANADMGRFDATQSLAEHGWQQSADCHGKTLVYSIRYNSVYLMPHCFVFLLFTLLTPLSYSNPIWSVS